MNRRVFVVLLTYESGGREEIAGRVAEAYPNAHRAGDNIFLVASSDLADMVAQRAGLKGDDRVKSAEGVVFKLNGAYAGYTQPVLWEWLSEAVQPV